MSGWRPNEVLPTDFLALLYGDEEEQESDVESSSRDGHQPLSSWPQRLASSSREDDDSDESHEAPPYSPRSWPLRRVQMEEYGPLPTIRDRSRSPIDHEFSSEYVPLDEAEEDDYLAPDAHIMIVSPVEYGEHERQNEMRRKNARRGGRRGVRGVRGRGVRGLGHSNRGRRRSDRWEVGQPLNVIWTSDEDVPSELVSLANDVIRRRQTGMTARVESAAGARVNDACEGENGFADGNGGADGFPGLEGENLRFEWTPVYESFQGQEEIFNERAGSVQIYDTAYDAFRSYWGDDILGHIVSETNSYATKITSSAFQSEWYPTNIHEILCLFSFWMMLGIVRMPTVNSCFSADPLLKTEVFRRMFSRNRYEMLNRALHFLDSDPVLHDLNPSTNSVAKGFDRLHRLRPIITHLNSSFQSNYILGKDICIDESLTLWKGRLDIKPYIRSKAAKFGIKSFELCESTTGYLWSFIIYTGKQTDLEQSPGELKSTAIVKKLIGPLLNKGYRLFMDDWYNSPLLARFLKLNGTDCVGTLSPTGTDVPFLINKAPLRRGELIARHSGDVSVLAWQDMKRITMISTCHGASTALPTVSSRPLSRPVPFKPQVVLDYNKFMGGVDMKDQILEPYLLERKRTKWYIEFFKRLLNVSILNSRILLQSSSQNHQDHLAFRLKLVDSILTNHLPYCPAKRRTFFTVSIPNHISYEPPGCGRYILSTHWPVLLEQSESCIARNRRFKSRCVVCHLSGKRKETTYRCESCNVPLCIDNCFKNYHTPPH